MNALAAIAAHQFPTPPQPAQDQTVQQYGLAIVLYLLAAEIDLFGMLSDEQLELAMHASTGMTTKDTSPIAIDAIANIRRGIAFSLRTRKIERDLYAMQIAPTAHPTPPRGHDRQDGDPKVAASPYPLNRPPAGEKVTINF